MKFIFIVLTFTCSLHSFAANQQVYYEPMKVELSGHLELQTFPGPPNYESIKNGDEIERYFYLILSKKVDVLVSDVNSNINSENIFDVGVFQLVVSNEGHWGILRKIGTNGKVKIIGTLFQRVTGHHHSRVLLIVEDVIAL